MQPEALRRQTGEITNAQLREIKKRSEIEAEVVTKENNRVARDMDEVGRNKKANINGKEAYYYHDTQKNRLGDTKEGASVRLRVFR